MRQGGRGRGGGGRLFEVHGGGGHGLQWRGGGVALLLLLDGGPVHGHLVEAGRFGLVAALHKYVEAGQRGMVTDTTRLKHLILKGYESLEYPRL